MFGIGKKILRSVVDQHNVEISEMDGVRSMYIDTNTVQSSMKVNAPYDLALNYSKGMMGFLLFKPAVKQTLMIGLGGGSIVKYIWKFCPSIAQTIVEINQQVIQIASSHFYLPDNDDKLNVVAGDGLAYLAALKEADYQALPEVLMIDAFDGRGIPPDFCTQSFFDDCEAVLQEEGMLVINLWSSDKNFPIYFDRIAMSFDGQLLKLPTGKPGNVIVFGFKGFDKPFSLNDLMQRANDLIAHDQIDFLAYVETLFDHNPHTNKLLLA